MIFREIFIAALSGEKFDFGLGVLNRRYEVCIKYIMGASVWN